MSASCRIGAMTAGLNLEQTDALSDFGRNFGMVYQLRDDILDLIDVNYELAKPAGQDLVVGIYNLPTLFALRDPLIGSELRVSVLGGVLDDDHHRERARKLVVATNGVGDTVAAAQEFLARGHEIARSARERDAAKRLFRRHSSTHSWRRSAGLLLEAEPHNANYSSWRHGP